MTDPITNDQFRAARNRLGLSIPELADWLMMSPRAVRRYEQDEGDSTWRQVPVAVELLMHAFLEGWRPAHARSEDYRGVTKPQATDWS